MTVNITISHKEVIFVIIHKNCPNIFQYLSFFKLLPINNLPAVLGSLILMYHVVKVFCSLGQYGWTVSKEF